MTNKPLDPFEKPDTPGPRPFAIGYTKSNGEGLFYGGLFFAFGFVVLGLFGGVDMLAYLAIVPLGAAFWYFPMIDRSNPQLAANDEGLFIERIGFIDWDNIQTMALSKTAVRSIELVTLEIDLASSLPEAIKKKHVFPSWKSFMTRNWSKSSQPDGTDHLAIQLNTLEGMPDEILDRLRDYREV
ncbi:hypothetical protein [Roseibium algae]|uniref:Uncharacterized protein n=1 Tax=Roseibium algae TaxID=3123038 RepID=A0ABU8TGY5_9HYPH